MYDNLKELKSVSATSSGLIPGFRVWTLKGFGQNGDLIAEVSEDMGSNQKKFKAFCEACTKQGKKLKADQVLELCSTLTLNIGWDSNKLGFFSWIKDI